MKKKMSLISLMFLFLFVGNSFAVEVLVWGPKKYSLATEPHSNYSETFTSETGIVNLAR